MSKGSWRLVLGNRAIGIALVLLELSIAGCSKTGGEDAKVGASADSFRAAPSPEQQLDELRRQGRFAEFAAGALAASGRDATPTARAQQTEALLALGRPADAAASALIVAGMTLAENNSALAGQSLKQWGIAQLRSSEPLNDPQAARWLNQLAVSEPAAAMLRFWQLRLRDRIAYSIVSAPLAPSTVSRAPGGIYSLADELCAIQAKANGSPMNLVFFDTGAQHTLMTSAAAKAAGVKLGDADVELVGFAGMRARPGMLDTLALGELVLADVPVVVGDWPPLVTAGGQMSLGTELLQHVTLTLDYPAGKVHVAPKTTQTALRADSDWVIPVWTFSQVTLASATVFNEPGEAPATARVLLDTGNRNGTFVAARWAREHLPSQERSPGPVIFQFKRREWVLDKMELGSRTLAEWKISGTIPAELERLDTLDFLIGHELLGAYVVTIDMGHRELILRGPSVVSTQPVPAESPPVGNRAEGE